MPFYRFHIELDMAPNVAIERLRTAVREPDGWFSSTGRGTTPFIGTVENDSFKMTREIRYRNSFLPKIAGRIAPTPSGSRISVTMFLHPFTAIFMTVFLGAVTRDLIRGVPGMLWFVFFLTALTAGGFFFEAAKGKQVLRDVLMGRLQVLPDKIETRDPVDLSSYRNPTR